MRSRAIARQDIERFGALRRDNGKWAPFLDFQNAPATAADRDGNGKNQPLAAHRDYHRYAGRRHI